MPLKPQMKTPQKDKNGNKPKTPKRKLREIFVNFQMEVCKNEARAIGMLGIWGKAVYYTYFSSLKYVQDD